MASTCADRRGRKGRREFHEAARRHSRVGGFSGDSLPLRRPGRLASGSASAGGGAYTREDRRAARPASRQAPNLGQDLDDHRSPRRSGSGATRRRRRAQGAANRRVGETRSERAQGRHGRLLRQHVARLDQRRLYGQVPRGGPGSRRAGRAIGAQFGGDDRRRRGAGRRRRRRRRWRRDAEQRPGFDAERRQ
jgi:hypothetical protein